LISPERRLACSSCDVSSVVPHELHPAVRVTLG
jgi:hypothetical protein